MMYNEEGEGQEGGAGHEQGEGRKGTRRTTHVNIEGLCNGVRSEYPTGCTPLIVHTEQLQREEPASSHHCKVRV